MKVNINSFNAGEVSPLMVGRTDLDSLRRAAAQMRNFLPVSTGGAIRRPSLLHLAVSDTYAADPPADSDPSVPSRLIPFTYSTDTRYVIQVSSTWIKIWRQDGTLAQSMALPKFSLYSDPLPSFDVDAFSFAQVNEVLFLAHPAIYPIRLTRLADDSWQFDYFAYNLDSDTFWPPMLDERVTSSDLSDAVDGWTDSQALAATTTLLYGGVSDRGAVAFNVISAPCPSTLKLYTGTTAFVGTIKISGADSYGSVSLTSGVTTLGSTTATCASTAAIASGMPITGTGISVGTTVASITNSTTLVLSQPATATGSALTFVVGTPATWTLITTLKDASTGAMALRYTWWHKYKYLQIIVTRTSGTATYNLTHLGSLAAPTVWGEYDFHSGTRLSLRSSPPSFTGYKFGDVVQIGHLRRNNLTDIQFTVAIAAATTSTSNGLYVFGDWEAYSTGIWVGQVYLEQLDSTGRWDVIRTWSGNKDYNFSASGTVVPGATLRLRSELTDTDPASGTSVYPRFTLKAVDGMLYQWGWAGNLGHGLNLSPDSMYFTMEGSVDYDTLCQATTAVSLAAFSPAQGYPSTVCVHDERLYFGGTAARPTSIWASAVDDLINFRRTGYDDGGFLFQIAANEGNPIQSMVSASRGIVMFTAGDEWLIDGADTGVTPTNITARRQSRYGAAAIQAIPAAGSVVFVQRGSLAVRDYLFDWTSQAFDSPELTELVHHLTTTGIRCLAYSQNPEGILWCVMNDGSLLTCSYNRKQQVIAWAKHTTAGTFESVAVTYGSSSQADDVWFVVLRNGRRRLERLDASFWANLYNAGPLCHLDAAVVQTGTAFTSVTGCAHLNGLLCQVVANGVVQPPVTVSGGVVTVPAGTTSAQVGLAFTSTLQPMPFDIPLADGTMQGRQVQTPQAAVRLYRTQAGQYADSPSGQSFAMKLPSADYTGVIQIANMSSIRDVFQMVLSTASPLPLNVLAVIPSVNIYG